MQEALKHEDKKVQDTDFALEVLWNGSGDPGGDAFPDPLSHQKKKEFCQKYLTSC